MSERVEHSAAYWAGFGREIRHLAFGDREASPLVDRTGLFWDGATHAHKVWATEERHAWAGSQDAVTRRVAELADVLADLSASDDYGWSADEAAGYRQGLIDAVAILTCAGCESAAKGMTGGHA